MVVRAEKPPDVQVVEGQDVEEPIIQGVDGMVYAGESSIQGDVSLVRPLVEERSQAQHDAGPAPSEQLSPQGDNSFEGMNSNRGVILLGYVDQGEPGPCLSDTTTM